MNNIKNFKIGDVPHHAIAFAATSDKDYEMNRVLMAEDWPEYGDITLINGSHCSCYGFDDTAWDATTYTLDEAKKVAQMWIEHGYWAEKKIAPLILAYLA